MSELPPEKPALISDIKNAFIKEEIEKYIERKEEREEIIHLYAKAHSSMQKIAEAIIKGDHETSNQLTKKALENSVEALEIMDDALIAGMAIVGIKFRENFIFVPEVLGCARAMKAGMKHIEPILSASGIDPIGKVIMGTVKGDLHDIGKNLCVMMLRGSGFEVIDLGVDTSPESFIEAVEKHGANIVGLSALLTTTMPNMGITIEEFIDADMRDDVMFMVGGAPVTPEFAEDMGADMYGDNAIECVEIAKRLVEMLKKR